MTTITKINGEIQDPKHFYLKLAFGYCRVSSEEQKGNYSIPQQKKSIIEFAERNGYKIVKFFVDDGFSATIDNRPDFLQMLNECENKSQKIQAVIVYHTDRFARNEYDHALHKRSLKKIGIELISVMQPMIDESPEGYLMDGMMASINAYYSRDLSRKTIRGMLGRWNAGWWPSWSPPGYVNINREGQLSRKFYSVEKQKLYDNLNRKLDPIEVDLITGHLIPESFQLYATGDYSYLKLASVMSKKGLLGMNGKPIAPQSMHAIITNPFYFGLMRHGGKEKVGKHKALISKGLFDLCHYVSARHRQFLTRSRKHQFLLRGMLYCAIHKGKKRVSGFGPNTIYEEDYRRLTACTNYDINSKARSEISYYYCGVRGGCPTTSVATEKLEEQVANYIKKMEFKPAFIELVKKKVKTILEQNRGDINGQIQGLENRRKGFKNKLNNLIDMRANGELTRETFKDSQDEAEARINEIDAQILELENKAKIDYRLVDEVLSLTTNIYQTYMDAPDFLKRHYLRLFFERIYIKDKKVWKIAENPVFSTLRRQQEVIIRGNWLRD
ncbi:MAG: recombinase family protein [Candidatus Paceibacterota bacterium]